MAWRFFEDDILQMGRKKWVELFFVDEKNCVSAILFHGYSRDNLEKLARDLFYEDVTLSDVKITAKFVPKKNEKQKPAILYHIAEFEVEEVADPETLKDLMPLRQRTKSSASKPCRIPATSRRTTTTTCLPSLRAMNPEKPPLNEKGGE
jgi:hypothetical protein